MHAFACCCVCVCVRVCVYCSKSGQNAWISRILGRDVPIIGLAIGPVADMVFTWYHKMLCKLILLLIICVASTGTTICSSKKSFCLLQKVESLTIIHDMKC